MLRCYLADNLAPNRHYWFYLETHSAKFRHYFGTFLIRPRFGLFSFWAFEKQGDGDRRPVVGHDVLPLKDKKKPLRIISLRLLLLLLLLLPTNIAEYRKDFLGKR